MITTDMENAMHIENSVAFVTGANRGIGRAFVDALLDRGAARVYAAARDRASLESLARLDQRVRTIELDVRNAAAASFAASLAPDVTLLINNAGTLSAGGPADVPLSAVRDDMETNFFGTLNVINAFVPALERHGGSIVNMLTLVALASMPALAAYNASKAAALSLTQSFRADLGKRGITVHGVFPGAVDTDMIRTFEMPKTPAIDVARATLDGIEAGDEDIFPDPMARQVYTAWRQDHKAVERQFATM
jgi:NAD(P)-dependent dehydrogenase (short-subunit alcohol dehydrogenase family)